MGLPVPMCRGRGGERSLAIALAVCVLVIGGSQSSARAGTQSQTQSQTSQTSPQAASGSQSQDAGWSSSAPHKNGATHHVRVAEDVGPAPELTKAEELIQKKDYAGAEPLLRKVLSDDSTNYVAWFELGFVENGLGKTDDSIAAYRKSVEAKPDVFESNLNLGLQLAKAGRPEADAFLRAATQLKPTSHPAEGQARAWLSLGHLLETTKPDEAIAAYHQASVLTPKDPEPHLSAGLLLEKEKKFSDAEREYKQALALSPSIDALTGLANIYMRDKRLPEAVVELRKLVAMSPDEAAPRIQLGRVLAAEGKNDDALAELEAGEKLVPGDVSLQRDLADLYVIAKKYDQAEVAYRALLVASPNDAVLHQSLGKSLVEERKFAEAQKEFMVAVKLKPDFGEAYGDLAFAASENKDYPLVINALEMRTKSLPDNPSTYFLRASAYDHLKDFKKAAVNFHLFLNTAQGKYPDYEWQAKHRLIAIEPKK